MSFCPKYAHVGYSTELRKYKAAPIMQKYLDCVEQLCDHGCDPTEERWPTATLHLASIPLDFHKCTSLLLEVLHDPGWVHVLHSGQEDSVDSPDFFQLAQVLFYRSGIGGEILVGRKLSWVNKN